MISGYVESPIRKYAPWVLLIIASIFLASCASKKQSPQEVALREETKSDCLSYAKTEKNWSQEALEKGCRNITTENLICFKSAIAHNHIPSKAGEFCSRLNAAQSDCAAEQIAQNFSFKAIKNKCK